MNKEHIPPPKKNLVCIAEYTFFTYLFDVPNWLYNIITVLYYGVCETRHVMWSAIVGPDWTLATEHWRMMTHRSIVHVK